MVVSNSESVPNGLSYIDEYLSGLALSLFALYGIPPFRLGMLS